MKYLIFAAALTVSFFSCNVSAKNAWYNGVVDRVALLRSDGSFVITFSSQSLDDCKHKYAYFEVSDLGIDRVKAAHAMALISLTSGMNFGVVIDKDINGIDGICRAAGMTADLRK